MTTRSSGTWMEYQNKINSNNDLAFGRFNEAVSQIKPVKSFNQEQRELDYYSKKINKIIGLVRPQSKYWHVNDFKRRLVLNIIFFAVYCFIFTQGARGALSAGDAVALILYSNQIRIPIFTISFLVDRTQRVISDSKDYFNVLEHETEERRSDSPNIHVHDGAIEFKDIEFSYDDKNKVLESLNFTVEPGQKVALVGESGGGKTTITNLLMGFYEPNKGSITIDGQEISKVNLPSLRRAIGAVFQTPSLFSGTIAENISYSKTSAKSKEIIAAAKAANAHEFIKEFKDGYKSFIGERGLKLSGGQQQRVAIARAIYKNAPILVLDEATSSLDSKSEILVQAALSKLMEDRTTIIIAHRLSTIANVDKILVIDNGTIVEQGSPKELAKSGGIYAQLLKLQKEGADIEELQKYDMVG